MASMAWYAATLPLIVSRKNATSASDRLMPSCRPTALSSSGVGSFALATDSSFFSGATLLADRSSLHVDDVLRSEEHTSELQSHHDLVCRLLLEKKKK